MNNIFYIDPIYIRYRRMWQDDRWKFSGEMVRLTIKQSNNQLSDEEAYMLSVLNRVVEENDNDWLDKKIPKKIRKRG